MELFQILIDIAPTIFSLLLVVSAEQRVKFAFGGLGIQEPLKRSISWRLNIFDGIVALFLTLVNSVAVIARHGSLFILFLFVTTWGSVCLFLVFWLFRNKDLNPLGTLRIYPRSFDIQAEGIEMSTHILITRKKLVFILELALLFAPLVLYFYLITCSPPA